MTSQNMVEIIIRANSLKTHQILIYDLLESEIPFAEQSSENDLEIASATSDLSDLIISAYFKDVHAANTWMQKLKDRYQDEIGSIKSNLLANEIWQSAWNTEISCIKTNRFMIHPDGIELESDRLVPIPIRANGAFGNGQHATTLAAVRLLEELPIASSLLDVGTGTGVLAIVAEKLGYKRIVATDIDSDAWESAHENFLNNNVDIPIIKASLPATDERFDVVISNILVPEILRIMPQLKQRLSFAPDAKLILSGFHTANKSLIVEHAEPLGLRLHGEHCEREWLALSFIRAS